MLSLLGYHGTGFRAPGGVGLGVADSYPADPAGLYDQARIALLDYVPGKPRTYNGLDWLEAAACVTVLLVGSKPVNATTTQALFAIQGGDHPTSLLYLNPDIGFGLNVFTPDDDTFDDLTVLDGGKLRLLEATIYNNDTSRYRPLLNGVALPHSVKPGAGPLPSRPFLPSLSFGLLEPNLPQFNWLGRISAAYVFDYDLSAAERQAMRADLRQRFPNVTQ